MNASLSVSEHNRETFQTRHSTCITLLATMKRDYYIYGCEEDASEKTSRILFKRKKNGNGKRTRSKSDSEGKKKREGERHFEWSVPVFINKNHDNQRAITRPSTKKHKPQVAAARLASRSCQSPTLNKAKCGNTAKMHAPTSLAGSYNQAFWGKESLPSAPPTDDDFLGSKKSSQFEKIFKWPSRSSRVESLLPAEAQTATLRKREAPRDDREVARTYRVWPIWNCDETFNIRSQRFETPCITVKTKRCGLKGLEGRWDARRVTQSPRTALANKDFEYQIRLRRRFKNLGDSGKSDEIKQLHQNMAYNLLKLQVPDEPEHSLTSQINLECIQS
ncbi:hypothetical protein WN51_00211 [Melipona quadrifasciata]|uniref:Uncharacterized protein n=1 Tax=Melipona quadrifasciata TaxID=166423 RepID=A0A0M9ADV2_9HYME|nr:hypothetical protein WN51_00211 [Melipona quadrifasciata]